MRHLKLYSLCLSILIYSLSLAESPSDHDIPTLVMRTYGSEASFITDFSLDLFCELLWQNLDAVNFSGSTEYPYVLNLMSLCDSAGVFFSFSPSEIMQYISEWAETEYRYWFRLEGEPLLSESCFVRCSADFDSLEQCTTAVYLYSSDTISIQWTTQELNENTHLYLNLWYYEVYDEANSWQRRHSVDTDYVWDDYLPNVYTQDTLANGILSLEEVEPSGIFSLQKYYAENDSLYPTPLAMNFALLHFIDSTDYTGLTEDIDYGTFEDQARSVRAMMVAEFQPPPDGQRIPDPVENYPDFISFDYYPFRYVCPESALTAPQLCDDDWLFLIDHIEEGLDSTVVPATEYDCPVYFFVQSFGTAGGPVMWDGSYSSLTIESYKYRKPAPQEFRMLCNLALLHQIKGIFPYNLCSYREFDEYGNPNAMNSSLMDSHNIPFDADYEDWRYTGRWPGDSMAYIRPDSIPPWIDGYDPLFSMSSPPDTSSDGERSKENWYAWHFRPYADLYNNLYDILAEVKIIGPEMYDLWWSEVDSTAAVIEYDDSPVPGNLVSPRIRVFEDSGQSSCYLFYVDRYCAADSSPYELTIDASELPQWADCSRWVLDHSRRFIFNGTWDSHQSVYVFLDTLEAGEGRLVELIDSTETIPADLRITSPDVFTGPSGSSTRNHEHRYTAGTNLYLGGTFYNMGTDTTGDVEVTFTDLTSSTVLGSDTISLDGISGYYQPDSVSTTMLWSTDSTDIGAHIIEIEADSIPGEEGHDNSVRMTVLLEPRDYATAVRGNPWDMMESGFSAWHTNDIDSVALNWDTTSTGWTDSVSSMFEGSIRYSETGGDHFRGEISLDVQSDSSMCIDTDLYHLLSMGITVNNSWRYDDNACSIFIQWNSADSSYGWQNLLFGTEFAVENGWDGWTVIGPIDLDTVGDSSWTEDDMIDLNLRIQSNPQFYPTPPDYPDSIDVRIGWIRLEESAQ